MDNVLKSPQIRHRACDPCRKRKIKCSRGSPCVRCGRLGLRCIHSPVKPMGRPRQHRPDTSLADPFPSSPMSPPNIPNHFNMGVPPDQTLEPGTSVSFLAPSLSTAGPVEGGWLDLIQLEDLVPLTDIDSLASLHNSSCGTVSRLEESSNGSTEPLLSCDCMELAHKQLSAMSQVNSDNLRSIKTLRQSTEAAEKVLCCTVCFSTNQRPSQVSGNPLLLGSLLIAIASCYNNVFNRQQQQAADSTRDASPIQLFLGQESSENCLLELSLSGVDYWRLLKAGLASELDRLSRVCELFAARQRRVHDHGHEECSEGLPCKKSDGMGAFRHPADACPKMVGARSSFTCFRMADQARTEIDKAQKRLLDT